MKNNKDTNKASTEAGANHHANPSRMNPEVAATQSKEHAINKKSKMHGLLNSDKGADEKRIHINGSTRIHRSDS